MRNYVPHLFAVQVFCVNLCLHRNLQPMIDAPVVVVAARVVAVVYTNLSQLLNLNKLVVPIVVQDILVMAVYDYYSDCPILLSINVNYYLVNDLGGIHLKKN